MKSFFQRIFMGLMEKTEKEIIFNKFDDVFNDLKENTVPMCLVPDATGEGTDIRRLLEARFESRRLPVTGYRRNLIVCIRETAQKLLANRDELRELYETRFKDDLLKGAIDYEAMQLLSYLRAIDFFNQYTRRLMVTLNHIDLGIAPKPVDIEYREWLKRRDFIDSYAIITNALRVTPKEFSVALSKLKDLSYDLENEELVKRMRGANTVDPLSTNLIPVVGDVTLWLMELKNTYTKYRYDQAKDEKARLELQLLYLERRKAEASEEELARIQKQIDYYTTRISKLEGFIEDTESSHKGYDYD